MKKIISSFLILLAFNISAEDFRKRAHHLATEKISSTESSLKAELEFGRGLAARILGLYPLVQNKKLQNYVNKLGAGVANMVGRPELQFHFAVINTMDVNAYACPGGYIFLTKGLMGILENEAQLVGVLGHEIAHVNEKHVIKKLKIKGEDESALNALGAIVGGATNSFRVALQTITQEGMKVLFEEGLSNSEELDSDKLALSTMEALGYKVESYKYMLENLKVASLKSRAQVVSKTHPKVQDRIKQVQDFVNAELKQNTQPKTQITNFDRFKSYVQL
ncbi:MAG: M48 family metalloprotease [Bacteriovoracaceae bacterium]